jgi:uncharacterized membrane protein
VISPFILAPRQLGYWPPPSLSVLSPSPRTFRWQNLILCAAIGGNIAISFIIMPAMRQISIPLDRVSAWSKSYDIATKIMAGCAAISTAAFGTAAYYAPTGYLQKSMTVSSLIAFSVIPWTLLVIMPTNKELKGIVAANDTLKANAEGDKLLVKWTKLSTIRLGLMTVGFLNALKELSEWYLL